MNGFVRCAVLALALAAAVAARGVLAQPADSNPKNPQIATNYVVPKDTKYRPIYDKLRQLQVLETLQEFLAPLKLPRTLVVNVDQCGALTVPYQPPGSMTICYEYIQLIEDNAPGGSAYVGQSRSVKR